MARLVRAMLPLILVTFFLLFQVSDCSRQLAPGGRQPRVPTAPPAAHRDAAAETGNQPVTVVITEDDDVQRSRTSADDDGAAPPPSMATASSSQRDKGQGSVDAGSSGHKSALLAGTQVLQRSKLARRRFLAGVVEGADSAARASCHSSDVHVSCTPPSEH